MSITELFLAARAEWKKLVGVLSCVVGLLCYALSLSFKSLFGEWNPTKIVLYAILSSAICIVVFVAEKRQVSGGFMLMLKAHFEFVVLMLTSLYSFFVDQSMKGKPDTLSVVSSGAFALTSMCLSLQIELGFQVGLFNFFLGCLTVQLMKIHHIFILVAAGFSYTFVLFRSLSEWQSENRDSSDPGLKQIHIDVPNNATSTQDQGISQQPSSSIGAQPWKWLHSFLIRLYGNAQNVEGNGNEGYGSMHENPNNLSRDELKAYYESEMTKMRRNHELQVQELTEEIFRIRREALIRKRASSVNQN